MVSRGPDQGEQRPDQQIPQARFAHGAVRVPSTALDHGKVGNILQHSKRLIWQPSADLRHVHIVLAIRCVHAQSYTTKTVVFYTRDCCQCYERVTKLQKQRMFCCPVLQDMVVFGGVNPLQDLNDVAIWQGM